MLQTSEPPGINTEVASFQGLWSSSFILLHPCLFNHLGPSYSLDTRSTESRGKEKRENPARSLRLFLWRQKKEKKLMEECHGIDLLQKRSTTDLISYFNRLSKQSQMHIVQLSEKYVKKTSVFVHWLNRNVSLSF